MGGRGLLLRLGVVRDLGGLANDSLGHVRVVEPLRRAADQAPCTHGSARTRRSDRGEQGQSAGCVLVLPRKGAEEEEEEKKKKRDFSFLCFFLFPFSKIFI